MGRAVKTVVAVAAAVAVPYVAPAISATLGTSAVVSGAIAGAGLQAASAAVTGGNIGKSALAGAIGGGIYGYANPGIATSATAPTSAAATTESLYSLPGSNVGSMPPVDYSLTSGVGSAAGGSLSSVGAMAPVDYSLTSGLSNLGGAGLQAPTFNASGIGSALSSGAPIDYSLGAYSTPSVGLQAPTFDASGVSNAINTGAPIDYSLGGYAQPSTGLRLPTMAQPTTSFTTPDYSGVTDVASAASPEPTASTTPAEPTSSRFGKFVDAVKQIPGQIAEKFTDPKALADMTLRAAGQLAGTAFAGDGLTPQEQQLLNQQTEELRTLQQTNRALFDQRLEQAQNLIGESKYFDPEYFGLQRARRAQIAGARAKRAGLRGLSDAARVAEGRRFDLGTARDVGTAFDSGYNTGVQGRLRTMQSGIWLMPTSMPDSFGGYNTISNAYANAEDRRQKKVSGVQELFGNITGIAQANSRG
jgi:hypothetical protein